jgi:hypothetical protein
VLERVALISDVHGNLTAETVPIEHDPIDVAGPGVSQR